VKRLPAVVPGFGLSLLRQSEGVMQSLARFLDVEFQMERLQCRFVS